MDITFTPTGGPPFALTGDTPDAGAQKLQGGGQGLLQILQPILAESIGLRDRRIDRIKLSFEVERTHASAGAAMAYWLQHLAAVRGVGVLSLTVREPSRAIIGRFTLAPAGIESRSGEPDGCATRFTYQVIGGKLNASP